MTVFLRRLSLHHFPSAHIIFIFILKSSFVLVFINSLDFLVQSPEILEQSLQLLQLHNIMYLYVTYWLYSQVLHVVLPYLLLSYLHISLHSEQRHANILLFLLVCTYKNSFTSQLTFTHIKSEQLWIQPTYISPQIHPSCLCSFSTVRE